MSLNENRPFRTAVIGLGGFAGAHHGALSELEKSGAVQVLATCDPRAKEWQVNIERHRLVERGVQIFPAFSDLLAACGGQLDLVSVVSPIPFHAEHHRQCVERQIACYLEKPPTLDPDELERMIGIEGQARAASQVGFNYISQAWRQQLKQRIVQGEFGRLRRVTFQGRWRRAQAYFSRNSWAGKLLLGDKMLLDSCCGNAMAHFVHNMLFHAGSGVMTWAAPLHVEAELYRVNSIEGADTIFARGTLEGGVRFALSATHACESAAFSQEVLQCEQADIILSQDEPGRIEYHHGRTEVFEQTRVSLRDNISAYCDFLRGFHPRPSTTLGDCRPFVHFNALLYVAAGIIHPIAPAHIQSQCHENDSSHTLQIFGIEAVCDELTRNDRLPSELPVPWALSGGAASQGDLVSLRATIDRILETKNNNNSARRQNLPASRE